MIRVGIIGATGYAGIELYKLLQFHPNAEVIAMGSREGAGTFVSDEFPHLIGSCELQFCSPSDAIFYRCDIVFFATPHGVAMNNAQQFIDKGIKVVDLSADFRIKDVNVWSKWYGMEHTATELLQQCVYGLPESHYSAIKNASLIANPGCYPTAVTLGLQPLLARKLINTSTIIADCKSGVSGAGRSSQVGILLCEASESFKAYGVNHHRHKPEIEQELSLIAKESIEIIFVPHLIPSRRGMLATLYVDLLRSDTDVEKLFIEHYQDNSSVHILQDGVQPQTSSVVGTNNCHIGLKKNGNKLIITSVIDNLIKGASGQAVQNMNLMFGLGINTGLTQIASK